MVVLPPPQSAERGSVDSHWYSGVVGMCVLIIRVYIPVALDGYSTSFLQMGSSRALLSSSSCLFLSVVVWRCPSVGPTPFISCLIRAPPCSAVVVVLVVVRARGGFARVAVVVVVVVCVRGGLARAAVVVIVVVRAVVVVIVVARARAVAVARGWCCCRSSCCCSRCSSSSSSCSSSCSSSS